MSYLTHATNLNHRAKLHILYYCIKDQFFIDEMEQMCDL